MTSPIDKQDPRAAVAAQAQPVCTALPPGWACSKPAGHEPPCEAAQVIEPPAAASPEQGTAPAAPVASRVTAALNSGTPVTFDQQPAAAYWLPRNVEADLDLPSGGRVRYRKIRDGSELELELVEMLDAFTPELLQAAVDEDGSEVARAVSNKETRAKIFDPVDRVVAAAVICPLVVMEGSTTDAQVNVKDIDLVDRMTIFNAAFGEQLSRLKSVLAQQEASVRDLPASESVRSEA